MRFINANQHHEFLKNNQDIVNTAASYFVSGLSYVIVSVIALQLELIRNALSSPAFVGCGHKTHCRRWTALMRRGWKMSMHEIGITFSESVAMNIATLDECMGVVCSTRA